MSISIFQRRICLQCRFSRTANTHQQSWVSTTSAINRGLRSTRSEGETQRGGRDRFRRDRAPSRPDPRPRASPGGRRRLSDSVDFDNGRSSERSNFRDRPTRSTGRDRFRDAAEDSDRRPPTGRSYMERRSAQRQSPLGFSNEKSAGRRPYEEKPSFGRPGSTRSQAGRRPESRPYQDRPSTRRDEEDVEEDLEEADGQSDRKPRTRLLKAVKNACRITRLMQEREANGENVSDLAKDVRHVLRDVNAHITTGSFENDEPAEAVVSLLRKKAKGDEFLAGNAPDGKKSVIFVTRDGIIDLAVGKGQAGRPDRDAASARARERSEQTRDRDTRKSRNRRDDDDENDGIPVSIPYTTAASQFVYGYNSVVAALRAGRRKLYKLYIHPQKFERESGMEGTLSVESPRKELEALAKQAKVTIIKDVKTTTLDRMSEDRPHNGVVLEASKLPALPVLSLSKPESQKGIIPITLADQSAEDAKVNGAPRTIRALGGTWRHPFIVLVDGIIDPGNLGSIIRTCHFYGVDAVAVATNTCANISSPVVAKASSGACEAMTLLSLPQPSKFVHDSQKYRWKIYASVAPPSVGSRDFSDRFATTSTISESSPLAKHPCILMLGAEGEGLRENLKARADRFVSIQGGPKSEETPDVGVDSMNVGVATGVLLEAFLRKPAGVAEEGQLGFGAPSKDIEEEEEDPKV